MKRLFFGPTNSTGIFHHEVPKAFAGLEGCIRIHDSILVYGVDKADHNRHMEGMLERAKECGRGQEWSRVSTDPDKIKHIKLAGSP